MCVEEEVLTACWATVLVDIVDWLKVDDEALLPVVSPDTSIFCVGCRLPGDVKPGFVEEAVTGVGAHSSSVSFSCLLSSLIGLASMQMLFLAAGVECCMFPVGFERLLVLIAPSIGFC